MLLSRNLPTYIYKNNQEVIVYIYISSNLYMYSCVSICIMYLRVWCSACVRACCIAISIYIYIIHNGHFLIEMLNVSVNVNIAALPSVGSVVSRDMTHAITGRRGALYQLLAIATTRGGSRREIQRVPPHIHTASNNINTIRHKATRLLVSLMPAP